MSIITWYSILANIMRFLARDLSHTYLGISKYSQIPPSVATDNVFMYYIVVIVSFREVYNAILSNLWFVVLLFLHSRSRRHQLIGQFSRFKYLTIINYYNKQLIILYFCVRCSKKRLIPTEVVVVSVSVVYRIIIIIIIINYYCYYILVASRFFGQVPRLVSFI